VGTSGGLYVALGRLMRTRRESAGMTQGELARLVGMTRTSISNIESGRQKLQIHTLYDVARALEVPPEALLPTRVDPGPKAVEDRLPPGLTPEEREWAMRLLAKDLS
jgi:transcriptional regulator with XRE-family HTH domain